MIAMNHSAVERPTLLETICVRLAESPAVALLGARQVGKTTLAQNLAASWPTPTTLFDLERPSHRAALMATPEKLLSELSGVVIIDEIQRVPELFALLRPICDDPNRKATFLLLGSASWDLVQGISETLAGRIQFVDVSGFSLAELGKTAQDLLWLRGGFPRAYLAESNDAWERWMDGFARTFLERDVLALSPRIAPAALARFWKMLAHYHGQTWNAAELARSMDISTATANHFRDLMVGTFMLRVLPPWFENLGKRLIKSPKVYFRDSGMLHHQLGIQDLLGLRTHPRYGASWEGFALEQTLIAHGDRDAYFYGTQRGAELDLLLHRRGKRWGFEFKCTEVPTTTRSMHIAMNDLQLEHLWVVYPGSMRFQLTEKITALPLCDVGDVFA